MHPMKQPPPSGTPPKANGDPAREVTPRFLRLPAVIHLTGLGRSTIYRLAAARDRDLRCGVGCVHHLRRGSATCDVVNPRLVPALRFGNELVRPDTRDRSLSTLSGRTHSCEADTLAHQLRYTSISASVATHIAALQRFSAIVHVILRSHCSKSHAAIVALAPAQASASV
jgi:hypothetical protein